VTPEQEEQVRRALGAVARAEDGPERQGIPLDVADRLDDVLHELVASRATRGTTLPAAVGQDELAARRHRRWPNVLVAAAAVAAIAAAGGAVATGGFGLGGQGDSGASSASDAAGGQVAPEDSQRGLTAPSPSAGGSDSKATGGIHRLSSRTLARDVEAVVAAGPEARLTPRNDGRRFTAPRHAAGVRCTRPELPKGAEMVDVLLDKEPATLVLDRVKDGALVARVYSCVDASALTRTIRVSSTN
jgi:hypothetical protein